MGKLKQKLEIQQQRTFSEEYKKSKVKELVSKKIGISDLSRYLQVSRTSIYNWLYKYSNEHKRGVTLVVQMESEEQKTNFYIQRVAELERVVGQKQLEVDFLNKLLELGSKELGFDIKKNFSAKLLNGTDDMNKSTNIK
jgi:transposase